MTVSADWRHRALQLARARSAYPAGTYSYTVTDANSCTATTTGTITEPSAVMASSSNTAILCHGGNSTVTVSADWRHAALHWHGHVQPSCGHLLLHGDRCQQLHRDHDVERSLQPQRGSGQLVQHSDSMQRRQLDGDGERRPAAPRLTVARARSAMLRALTPTR